MRHILTNTGGCWSLATLIGAIAGSHAPLAAADEGGVSFWLPGQYASFAAIEPTLGFSLPMQTYYYSGSAGANKALNRGENLSFGIDADFLAQFIAPTWTPNAKFLGAQPSFAIAFFAGWNEVSADVGLGSKRIETFDSVAGFGDLYPTVQLFWSSGVHNWMTYLTGSIPVGSYDPDSLANLGLGHAAIDAGGAYTYLNSETGWEFSVTAGLTYNFENKDTEYTSGIDSHVDVGLSRFLSERLFVGAVGFAYVQLTPDEGEQDALGDFESRTFALGPQLGYNFGVDGKTIYTNLRGYYEFNVQNRTGGASAFLTVSIPFD